MAKTREPQYEVCFDRIDELGRTRLGLMSNQVWQDDPRRLTFVLSRYKFVAKMLSGMSRVLEIGCADAFGSRVVLQEVGALTAVDFDPVFIEDARACTNARWPIDLRVHDMLAGPVEGPFDGAYSLDVLEHIASDSEDRFLANIVQSMTPAGTLILGSPSLESQAYASPPSREGHVNCKDSKGLKELCHRYFHNVFVFSMNDEVVHTGYYPMAHYLIALCCSPKARTPQTA